VTRRVNSSHQSDNDLLTESQAREQELPMSLAWFRRKRVHGGGPPFIRVGNRIFYRRAELRRWIADRATPAVAPGDLLGRGRAGAWS
jgi:hypothetical protein